MGRNPDPLPDECDFCGQSLDEDEELVGVWTGDPPLPKARSARATADKPTRGAPPPTVLGRSAPEWKALTKALSGAGVEVSTTPKVATSDPVVSETPDPTPLVLDKSKAGATVRVEPGFEEPEPDLLVCELCEEAFSP